MKVQVITRAFYEDVYLDFFIKYYLSLGFNRIVILKADREELGEYELSEFTEEQREKILIKYVINEGNGIYKNKGNIPLYLDNDFDWSLHIDVDEFLVYDTVKYKHIHDFINSMCDLTYNNFNKELDSIRLRWLCINKLNDKLDVHKLINNVINPEFVNREQVNNTNVHTFNDYLYSNKMEIYRFVKTLYKIKSVNNKVDEPISAHYAVLNDTNTKLVDSSITNNKLHKEHVYTSEISRTQMYKHAFILHFNTRSYSNALTKCLVTQLRDNKKIANMPEFIKFINTLPVNTINDYLNDNKLSINTFMKVITELKNTYLKFLNSKGFFPNKIAKYDKKYNYLITRDNYISLLKELINNNHELICETAFGNYELEQTILSDLCNKHGINYDNIKLMISLF